MRPLARIAGAAALAVALALPAAAKSKREEEPDLSGTYTISAGTLPNGDSYEGTLKIALKTRLGGKHGSPIWGLTWNISSAEEPVRGIGVFINGAFFVAYGPGDDYGLEVFLRITNGSRDAWMLADDLIWGTWFAPNGSSGQEALRGDVDGWNGDYRMHGHTLSDGDTVQPYSGNLSASKSGEVVKLRWSGHYTKGRDKPFDYPGIGVEAPGFMAAQWSHSGKGGVGMYIFEGESMTGLFAEDDGIGHEKVAVPAALVARIDAYVAR